MNNAANQGAAARRIADDSAPSGAHPDHATVASVPAGASLADVLHPSMFAPAGSLAEADPSHVRVSIDFAEGDTDLAPVANFVPETHGREVDDTDRDAPGLVTRTEAEDTLLMAMPETSDSRPLGDSLEGAATGPVRGDAEVDPTALGLEEYDQETRAQTESRKAEDARDAQTRMMTGNVFSDSATVHEAEAEPFNTREVFRELAEVSPARDTRQTMPGSAPEVSNTAVSGGPAEARLQPVPDEDLPEEARSSESLPVDLPATEPPADGDDGILMLDDDPEELDGPEAGHRDEDASAEESELEGQVSFAEPVDWSALETDTDEEAYDLSVTARDTEAVFAVDSSEDPFASAPASVNPEEDFAELGFHHNFIIGDFSSDRGVETDAIELDLSGLDFDDEAAAG